MSLRQYVERSFAQKIPEEKKGALNVALKQIISDAQASAPSKLGNSFAAQALLALLRQTLHPFTTVAAGIHLAYSLGWHHKMC